MRLEPITDRMYLVAGRHEGSFPWSFSVLIVGDETVLIDTGCGIDDLMQLREEHRIDRVINSHTHPDHSAGNWVFEGRPIQVPEEGFDRSGNAVALSESFVSPDVQPVFQQFVRDTFGFRDCRPTGSYGAGTALSLGGTALQPLLTPGHTKDHYCFWEPDGRVLLSFDYDLTSFPWYGHRESSLCEFRESLQKLRALSPRIVVSGHRGIVTGDIDGEFETYLARLAERDGRILALLEGGRTLDQLVECAPVYGGFPYAEPLLRDWERQMIAKHLEELEAEGRVTRRDDVYVRSG